MSVDQVRTPKAENNEPKALPVYDVEECYSKELIALFDDIKRMEGSKGESCK